MLTAIILCVIAYFIGSLSSAIFVCKFFNLPDPRTQGSKNPGTTNVLRIGDKVPALVTLGGDVLKGFLPVIIGRLVGIEPFLLAAIGLAAFLGHLYPVFFKFEGGKGVATFLGATLAMSPLVALIAGAVWVVTVAITRYASLASIIVSLLVPVLLLIFAHVGYFIPTIIMTALLIWSHQENIQRLRTGVENKINF